MRRLRQKTFAVHLVAFLLMVLPPVPMYYAAQAGATFWMAVFVGLVVLGNLLVLIAG